MISKILVNKLTVLDFVTKLYETMQGNADMHMCKWHTDWYWRPILILRFLTSNI